MAGWRIGFMVGNKTLVNALARIKSYHDYGTFTPLQVAAIAALEAISSACAILPNSISAVAMCWSKGFMRPAGWWSVRKRLCTCGRKYRNLTPPWGRWSLRKSCLMKRRFASRRGLALADYGDTHVACALIENGTVRARRSAVSRRCSARMVCWPPRASAAGSTAK